MGVLGGFIMNYYWISLTLLVGDFRMIYFAYARDLILFLDFRNVLTPCRERPYPKARGRSTLSSNGEFVRDNGNFVILGPFYQFLIPVVLCCFVSANNK